MQREGNEEVFQEIYEPFHNDPLSLKENVVRNQAKSKGLSSQSIGFLIMFILFGAGNVAQLILNKRRTGPLPDLLSSDQCRNLSRRKCSGKHSDHPYSNYDYLIAHHRGV